MFGLAIQWRLRADNPARGIPRYPEERRDVWLRDDQLKRLTAALEQHPNRDSANAIQLLLLTGARKSEALRATWDQFDLDRGVWTKPSAHTKQKRTEHVPLSAPAIELLSKLKRSAESEHVFPGRAAGQPLENVKNVWAEVRKMAQIENCRIHDLRHTYASHLVSDGVPLAIVGKLIGHTQSQTTERYAHLADSALRRATDLFGRKVEKHAASRRVGRKQR
jgi:integrase